MRVASGAEDLTFSVQPKWEWDLCGGVALLVARGLAFERIDRAAPDALVIDIGLPDADGRDETPYFLLDKLTGFG